MIVFKRLGISIPKSMPLFECKVSEYFDQKLWPWVMKAELVKNQLKPKLMVVRMKRSIIATVVTRPIGWDLWVTGHSTELR